MNFYIFIYTFLYNSIYKSNNSAWLCSLYLDGAVLCHFQVGSGGCRGEQSRCCVQTGSCGCATGDGEAPAGTAVPAHGVAEVLLGFKALQPARNSFSYHLLSGCL